jgi:hypothetical protein
VPGECPSLAARTTPQPPRDGECCKKMRKVNGAFGLEFQQHCAQIVHFVLPHEVDGTRNCHDRTPSQRLVVGENAYRGCLDDALRIEGD